MGNVPHCSIMTDWTLVWWWGFHQSFCLRSYHRSLEPVWWIRAILDSQLVTGMPIGTFFPPLAHLLPTTASNDVWRAYENALRLKQKWSPNSLIFGHGLKIHWRSRPDFTANGGVWKTIFFIRARPFSFVFLSLSLLCQNKPVLGSSTFTLHTALNHTHLWTLV